jgi:hypothetical protein
LEQAPCSGTSVDVDNSLGRLEERDGRDRLSPELEASVESVQKWKSCHICAFPGEGEEPESDVASDSNGGEREIGNSAQAWMICFHLAWMICFHLSTQIYSKIISSFKLWRTGANERKNSQRRH